MAPSHCTQTARYCIWFTDMFDKQSIQSAEILDKVQSIMLFLMSSQYLSKHFSTQTVHMCAPWRANMHRQTCGRWRQRWSKVWRAWQRMDRRTALISVPARRVEGTQKRKKNCARHKTWTQHKTSNIRNIDYVTLIQFIPPLWWCWEPWCSWTAWSVVVASRWMNNIKKNHSIFQVTRKTCDDDQIFFFHWREMHLNLMHIAEQQLGSLFGSKEPWGFATVLRYLTPRYCSRSAG